MTKTKKALYTQTLIIPPKISFIEMAAGGLIKLSKKHLPDMEDPL